MLISPKIRQILKPNKSKKSMILTGGGLCPGLNTVVKQLVFELSEKNREIVCFKNGYNGIVNNKTITPQEIEYNHLGSCLGMSRDKYEPSLIADELVKHNASQLYVIGGDGSLTYAHEVADLVKESIQIIGIPKTIDNDIAVIDHSFGFYSAVDSICEFIECAHIEAKNYNTISIVETMGRNSGHLAAYAAGLSEYADYCIIPETMKDPMYHIYQLKTLFETKGHCTVILSEACGKHFTNAFINILKSRYANLKYISPGYMTRNVKVNAYDALYCKSLAHYAVLLGERKYSDCAIGKVNSKYAAIPLESIAGKQKKLSHTDPIHMFL